MSTWLFYCGVALAGIALVAGAVALVVFALRSKRLKERLEEEYGSAEK